MSTANKKELAVVAITRNGARIGREIKAFLPKSDLYIVNKFAGQSPGEHSFSLIAGNLIGDIFARYKGLVLIMAVGIAVRLIAQRIKNKRTDAGVVVVDDSGQFVVSLLSGHIGGANALTKKIASLVGAQPVITTASDARGVASLDVMAHKYDWQIEDVKGLTGVSAALVNDDKVGFYQDSGQAGWSPQELSPNTVAFSSIAELDSSGCKAAVIITDRLVDREKLRIQAAIFHPKSLVLGIGCNRGTRCDEIAEAVKHVLSQNGLSMLSVRSLATADLKRNESGLLEFAATHGLTIEYFEKESLAGAKFPSKPSAAALKHVGLPSVCEAAAIVAGSKNIVVPKTVFKNRITLAVSRVSSDAIRKGGKLFIVGIGPGDPVQMTVRARQAISASDVVVGYRMYLELCGQMLAGKQTVAGSMGKEIERVNKAVELAAHGKVVSLISSGDPGVYGMAGLAFEILEKSQQKIDVEVVPGVPAVAAAASLLGAPLNVDVASVSLSDHLVPWATIARRLGAAAKGDFVIAIYNPRSKARRQHLSLARDIILKHRSPATPVGIVASAYRQGQDVTIATLDKMLDHPVDMDSIVIVGNSTTRSSKSWMITPRGYASKYTLSGDTKPGRRKNPSGHK